MRASTLGCCNNKYLKETHRKEELWIWTQMKRCPNSFHSTCDTLSALFEIVVIHGSTIGPSWGVASRPLGTHQPPLRWWTYEQLSSESTMCSSEVLNDFQSWKACSQQSSSKLCSLSATCGYSRNSQVFNLNQFIKYTQGTLYKYFLSTIYIWYHDISFSVKNVFSQP